MMALAAVVVLGVATGYLAAKLFAQPRAAGMVALLVATMPLLVLNAHHAWNNVVVTAALCGWLAAVDAFERRRQSKWLAMAGGALGIATVASGTGMVSAPLLLAVMVIALLTIDDGAAIPLPVVAVPVAAFLVVVVPFLVYLAINPQWYLDRVNAYGLYDASRFNVLQGAREVTSWVGLTARSEIYWHYLAPSFLFLSGETVAEALAAPQIFLLPFAVLLPLGAVHVFSRLPARTATALVAWFLLAPVAGALIVRPPVASRLIVIGPAAAILTYAGLLKLMTPPHPGTRIVAMALVAVLALHAAAFLFASLG